mgnify:CR=1 FL=1
MTLNELQQQLEKQPSFFKRAISMQFKSLFVDIISTIDLLFTKVNKEQANIQ